MTKKDFKAIAEIIKQNEVNPVNPQLQDYLFRESLIEGLADYLSTTNPHFDPDRFLAACGVN